MPWAEQTIRALGSAYRCAKIFTGAEAKREFAKLKEGWAKLDENKPLQLAAGGGRSGRGKGTG